jgi:acyl-CoA synthetase (AMP-forming)/AMP-acid ligase II
VGASVNTDSRRCRPVSTPPGARERYFELGYWTTDTLPARLLAASGRNPDRLAVIDLAGRRRVTYRELQQDVNRTVRLLQAQDVHSGDVVAVQLPNWYETVVLDLAVLTLGCTLNPMLPIYRAREITHMVNVAETKLLITPDVYRKHSYRPMVEEIMAAAPTLRRHTVVPDPEASAEAFSEMLGAYSPDPVDITVDAEDVSELMFSSGTESQPKAIMHTECTTNFSVRRAAQMLGLRDEDIVWMPSPIGHSTGFNFGVRVALYHGLTLVLQDQWNAQEAVHLVNSIGCTFTVAATTFLQDLVDTAAESNTDVSSMRLFGSGGAAVPAELVERAADAGITVMRLYGSTEILIGTWNRPDSPLEKRIQTDGLPFEGVEVRIDGAGPGQHEAEGEILVRSPSMSVGYFNDPERTAATFGADGWASTGDLGILDSEGYLTIVGRKKEIIIRGGLNVAPREVEEVIAALPQVSSVSVVGLPHPRLGEIGCACVVLAPGGTLTLDELVSELRQRGMAAYKLPERLVILDELPTTSSGKVQKHVLREIISDNA